MKPNAPKDWLDEELDNLPLEALPGRFTARTMQRVRQYEMERAYAKPSLFLDLVLSGFLALFVGFGLFSLLIGYRVFSSPAGLELRLQAAYWLAALSPFSSVFVVSIAALLGFMIVLLVGISGFWIYQTNRDTSSIFVN